MRRRVNATSFFDFPDRHVRENTREYDVKQCETGKSHSDNADLHPSRAIITQLKACIALEIANYDQNALGIHPNVDHNRKEHNQIGLSALF